MWVYLYTNCNIILSKMYVKTIETSSLYYEKFNQWRKKSQLNVPCAVVPRVPIIWRHVLLEFSKDIQNTNMSLYFYHTYTVYIYSHIQTFLYRWPIPIQGDVKKRNPFINYSVFYKLLILKIWIKNACASLEMFENFPTYN